MKKHNDSDTLFREYPNMPSEFTKIMDEKDTRKFMREQYQMLQLQRREYKKNTWLLIISIIIALASLIVSIIALYR
ncbi:hypothetical protein DW204_10060 [Phocaeicola plebeius]|jgi:hypothetical protein|uniref:Uncharacterized protein n=1 Tax=Phocaeicola plebeius TaxID=310297 RepID=A0A414RJI7_9BACT|nr:hypothetical protein [Phocaeicola plebeius]RHF93356.1 hypothetical protein DW653_00335 [Phocaeicola plebeius]RHH43182.1 hypothetical protein DW204_10060 [Phocaeicola plebeius]